MHHLGKAIHAFGERVVVPMYKQRDTPIFRRTHSHFPTHLIAEPTSVIFRKVAGQEMTGWVRSSTWPFDLANLVIVGD